MNSNTYNFIFIIQKLSVQNIFYTGDFVWGILEIWNGGILSGGILSWGDIFWGDFALGGYCPGDIVLEPPSQHFIGTHFLCYIPQFSQKTPSISSSMSFLLLSLSICLRPHCVVNDGGKPGQPGKTYHRLF